MVWKKLYISQFKGIFKTLLPATERSLSVISYMDNTHCATEIYMREQQRNIGMVTSGGQWWFELKRNIEAGEQRMSKSTTTSLM